MKNLNEFPCNCGHMEKDHIENHGCWNCKIFVPGVALGYRNIRYNCKQYRRDNLRYLENLSK
jgi:hypothetical protein